MTGPPKLSERFKKANEILKVVKDLQVYAPRILKIELATILGRKKSANLVKKFIDDLTSELITNDRIMANNAKKYGIEAYYLIKEFDNIVDRLKRLKS